MLYTCIPNSAHVGVVPIPTSHGVSKQRYPDIAALKQDRLLFVEVELALSETVVTDIILRFKEMRQALNNPKVYTDWANKIADLTKLRVPPNPTVETLLVIVNQRPADRIFLDVLNVNGVDVDHLPRSVLSAKARI